MRTSVPSTVAVIALLLVAGCAGLTGPSPDEFPAASSVGGSTFDTHATALGNTSFTLTAERIQKDRNIGPQEGNYTYRNGSATYFVEQSDSQYIAEFSGYFVGENVTVQIYSNGSYAYEYWDVDNDITPRPYPSNGDYPLFDESSDEYLWDGWFDPDDDTVLTEFAINATYEREGIETFQGTDVMRYEASGVAALPEVSDQTNNSEYFESFSATLLIDSDGVIRYYEYDFRYINYHTKRLARSYTVSELGSTTVETLSWMANTTAES